MLTFRSDLHQRKKLVEHVHARVCSALTYSVLQCPGVMPGFTGDWHIGPLSGLCLQGWHKPWLRYGLWTMRPKRQQCQNNWLCFDELFIWIIITVLQSATAVLVIIAVPRPRHTASTTSHDLDCLFKVIHGEVQVKPRMKFNKTF